MILAFIDLAANDMDEEERETLSLRRRRESRRGSADQISVGLDIVGRAGGENRPVRRGLSKEKKQQMAIAVSTTEEEDDGDFVMEVVPKTPDELTRIKAAVKANFLFQHLNETQAKQVYDVMKRVAVKKGDVVIRQHDQVSHVFEATHPPSRIAPPPSSPRLLSNSTTSLLAPLALK